MATGAAKEAMRQAQQTIAAETTGPGLYEVTADVVHLVCRSIAIEHLQQAFAGF